MNLNYLVWIANLGVVPLFLFSFFLFAPIFLCFALRRFSVTAVRDAMIYSLSKSIKKRLLLIAFMSFNVKESIAMTHGASESLLLMTKGEQKEVTLPIGHQFSLGNREILSVFKKNKNLLLKAKKTGFTDLIIWKDGIKERFKIYILPQSTFKKMQPILEVLQNTKLTLEMRGQILILRGEIDHLEDYSWLKSLEKIFKKELYFEVKLSSNLLQNILSHIYQQTFSQGIVTNCENQFLHFECFYPAQKLKKQMIFDFLEKKYFISFSPVATDFHQKNFKIKMKIILYENVNQKFLDLGLSQLETQMSQLFDKGLFSLIENNKISLSQSDVSLKAIAEPELIATTESPSIISIGSKIPFQNIQQKNNNLIAPISWQFAGLKIKSQLIDEGLNLRLTFQTEFSRPSGEGISGNKKSGDLFIKLNTPYKIFHINYQTDSTIRNNIPEIGKWPILKWLFSSQGSENEQKRLEAYVQIEEAL
jgi:hypothetical protein